MRNYILTLLFLNLVCILAFGQDVKVTQTDTLVVDKNMDGIANPGDSIRYKVTITVNGDSAKNVVLDTMNFDPALMIDMNSLHIGPLARKDSFDCIGNVGLDVPAMAGLLSNDVDLDNNSGTLTITMVGATSTNTAVMTDFSTVKNGTANVNADGSFTYVPPPGVEGVDTFRYKLSDGDPVTPDQVGLVCIAISNMVWFVDNSSIAATSDGRLTSPFKTLAEMNTANGMSGMAPDPQDGQIIYIAKGNADYSGGLTLRDNQVLFGQGASESNFGTLTGLTIPPHSNTLPSPDGMDPLITCATGPGIKVIMNNTIRGINVGATSGMGFTNDSQPIGTLTISEVVISGSGGGIGIDDMMGTLDVTFESISSTGGGEHIVFLYGPGGTVTVNGGSATNITEDMINITSGSANLTYKGSLTQGNNNDLVRIRDGHTGTVTFETGTLSATNGIGIFFSNADGIYNFNGTTTLNGGDAGIDIISGSDGTFTFSSSTTITNPSGHAVDIDGGAGTIDYNGTISNNAMRAVEVTNRTGGTVSFDGSITETGTGINLNTNGSGTVTFSGGLTLNTGANTAFNATTSGTINVTGTNTVGSTTALTRTAINISDVTIGGSGVTFQSVNVNGGGTSNVPAIILDNTGSGTFTVTGIDGPCGNTMMALDCDGGTIRNINGSQAITLDNTGGLVFLKNVLIEDISANSDATSDPNTGGIIPTNGRTGVNGIFGKTVNGGLKLDQVTMRKFSDNAILGASTSTGEEIPGNTWNGLDIRNSFFEHSNRFHIGTGSSGKGDDNGEGLIRIIGIRGTVFIENNIFQKGAELLDFFATGGTLTMTVQKNTFTESIKEFCQSGCNPINVGKRGVDVEFQGSASGVIKIGDPAETDPTLGNTFTNIATASININQLGGAMPIANGDIDVVISQNDFVITDHLTGPAGSPGGSLAFNHPQGGVFLNTGDGPFEALVSQNLFDQVMHGGRNGQLSITMDADGQSDFIIRQNEFKLPWDFAVDILADGNASARMLFDNNTWTDGFVGGPVDDVGFSTPSPCHGFEVNVRNSGILDLKLLNEVLPQQDDVSGSCDDNSFEASINTSGGILNLHLDDSKSPDDWDFDIDGGTLNLFSEMGCPRTAAEILRDNGNFGGNGMAGGFNGDNTSPPVVHTSGFGTINCSTSPPAPPSVTIPLLATNMNSGQAWPSGIQLTNDQLTWVKESLHLPQEAKYHVTNLSDRELGSTFTGVIRIDHNAAGHGWFVDPTPDLNEEFTLQSDGSWRAIPGSPAFGKMDLLTVLLHELEHVAGKEHSSDDLLMQETLAPGVRKLPKMKVEKR